MHRLVITLLMALALVFAPSAMAASCAAQPAPIEQSGHCAGDEPARDDAAPVQGVHCALCSAVAPRIVSPMPTATAPVAVQRPPMLAALGSLAAAIELPPPRISPHA